MPERPADCFSSPEVLARSTSIKDELEILKKGTVLYKVRDKGVMGLQLFRRHYRLAVADLNIVYHPNKGVAKNACLGGGGELELWPCVDRDVVSDALFVLR